MSRIMGCFGITMGISSLTNRRDVVEFHDVLVDTGSEYTWVPRDILQRLEIPKEKELDFVTANGVRVRRDAGYALVYATGRSSPETVVFAEPGDLTLLGAHALEGLNFRVDPVEKRLVDRGPVFAAVAA